MGAIVLALVATGHADRIHLRSGSVFDVDRWWREGDAVYYERFGGVIAVPERDVVSIETRASAPTLEQAPGPGHARERRAASPGEASARQGALRSFLEWLRGLAAGR